MRDPKFEPMRGAFRSLNDALEHAQKNPVTGLTQGGSSDKYAGCKSAAIDGNTYRKQPTKENTNG